MPVSRWGTKSLVLLYDFFMTEKGLLPTALASGEVRSRFQPLVAEFAVGGHLQSVVLSLD